MGHCFPTFRAFPVIRKKFSQLVQWNERPRPGHGFDFNSSEHKHYKFSDTREFCFFLIGTQLCKDNNSLSLTFSLWNASTVCWGSWQHSVLALTRCFEIPITEFIQQGGLVNVSRGEIYSAILQIFFSGKEVELWSQPRVHLTVDIIYARSCSETHSSWMTVEESAFSWVIHVTILPKTLASTTHMYTQTHTHTCARKHVTL